MEIAVLGALDRYNYGDLLFPLILKEYLQKNNKDRSVSYYSLIEANMEKFGSVKTRPFGEFYRKYKDTTAPNIIIIAGGRVVGTRAGILYSFLKPTPLLNFIGNLSKVFHLPNPADAVAKKKINITWGSFPFCPAKPNARTLLIYNAVGGNPGTVSELLDNLRYADYLSVRNPHLFNELRKHFDEKKIALCPDSAAVMPKIWPGDSLESMATAEAAGIRRKYQDGYIAFQAKAKTKRHILSITQQLRQLYHKTKLPILLVPLGRAHRHEDHVFLNRLAKRLDVPSQMANITFLYDIMYLIAHSSLFIGTSLHGNITAMSYAVPHFGITNIPKLDQYLKYWDIEPNNITGTIKPSQIYNAALNVLAKADRGKLLENATRLSVLSANNLKAISEAVSQYETSM